MDDKLVKMAVLVTAIFCSASFGTCDLQDMTWVMDMERISSAAIYNAPEYKFIYKIQQAGPFGDTPFVAFNSYSTVEHMGTHMDAPYHFSKHGLTMDKVPLADLMGALVRIDISAQIATVADAEVTVEDLLAWEEKHGQIPDRSYVLMYSGWDRYYGNDTDYIRMDNNQVPHYPGFNDASAKWLLDNRDILGIGVDTVGCDVGKEIHFPVHRSILPANKVCIENLKDVGKVPACGARFMMLPIMMKGGTGTQGRAFAEWYPGVGYKTDCKSGLRKIESFFDTGKAHSNLPSTMILIVTAFISVYVHM